MTVADNHKSRTVNGTQAYLHGFDYLRAFFSVCVVLVHLGYIAPSKIFDRGEWEGHALTLSDAVNFYVLTAAVPVFFVVSCFLVAIKSKSAPWRQVFRALRLMVFWGLLFQFTKVGAYTMIGDVPRSPSELMIYLISGFGTVYYFFFSLGLLIVVTHAAKKLSDYSVYALCVLTTIVVGLIPLFAVQFELPQLTSYNLPISFIPYPFFAIAIARLQREKALQYSFLFAGVGLLLALLDWSVYKDSSFFDVNLFAIPAYSRPSLVLISVAIVLAATLFSSPAKSIIKFMSAHSLALYCLHPFTISAVKSLADKANLPEPVSLPVQLALVLALCYTCSAFVLPLFLRRDMYC